MLVTTPCTLIEIPQWMFPIGQKSWDKLLSCDHTRRLDSLYIQDHNKKLLHSCDGEHGGNDIDATVNTGEMTLMRRWIDFDFSRVITGQHDFARRKFVSGRLIESTSFFSPSLFFGLAWHTPGLRGWIGYQPLFFSAPDSVISSPKQGPGTGTPWRRGYIKEEGKNIITNIHPRYNEKMSSLGTKNLLQRRSVILPTDYLSLLHVI